MIGNVVSALGSHFDTRKFIARSNNLKKRRSRNGTRLFSIGEKIISVLGEWHFFISLSIPTISEISLQNRGSKKRRCSPVSRRERERDKESPANELCLRLKISNGGGEIAKCGRRKKTRSLQM